jgi:hypothetical protein
VTREMAQNRGGRGLAGNRLLFEQTDYRRILRSLESAESQIGGNYFPAETDRYRRNQLKTPSRAGIGKSSVLP